ncbi:MAG: hypothetical protein ACP5HH_07205 [Fervidicoccaceae archaeon]
MRNLKRIVVPDKEVRTFRTNKNIERILLLLKAETGKTDSEIIRDAIEFYFKYRRIVNEKR